MLRAQGEELAVIGNESVGNLPLLWASHAYASLGLTRMIAVHALDRRRWPARPAKSAYCGPRVFTICLRPTAATNCNDQSFNNNSNLISEAKRTQFRAIKVLDSMQRKLSWR